MNKIIICIDRDGTLIHDKREHLFLGRDDDWQAKVKILPLVIDGLKKMRTLPNAAIYMITNQAGVAISDYPLLTIEKAREVCQYVVDGLNETGPYIDGYFLCPHATPEYVRSKPGVSFDKQMVHDCHCLKPALGMVFEALKAEGITRETAKIFVIGDRTTDVQTALNINGCGILIPFENEPGELDKTQMLQERSRIYIAENLLQAAEFIYRQETIIL